MYESSAFRPFNRLVPKSDCSPYGIGIDCIWSEETMTYENNNDNLHIIS